MARGKDSLAGMVPRICSAVDNTPRLPPRSAIEWPEVSGVESRFSKPLLSLKACQYRISALAGVAPRMTAVIKGGARCSSSPRRNNAARTRMNPGGTISQSAMAFRINPEGKHPEHAPKPPRPEVEEVSIRPIPTAMGGVMTRRSPSVSQALQQP
jgi:hypothetical protein